MGKIKVHAWDILRMIPDEEIAKIAKDSLQMKKICYLCSLNKQI